MSRQEPLSRALKAHGKPKLPTMVFFGFPKFDTEFVVLCDAGPKCVYRRAGSGPIVLSMNKQCK